MAALSIIVPVLDEAEAIVATLEPLQPARRAGVEVLVVDAGSRDATCALARPLADHVLQAPRGRAAQMNAGAAAASGEVLLFLHADTLLPAALRERVVTSGRRWERHGIFRTIVLMWRLRAAYALGADPHRLARRYEVERTSC